MSCRMKPARMRSRWLGATASAGSSRRVGTNAWDQRMTARLAVLAGHAGRIAAAHRRGT